MTASACTPAAAPGQAVRSNPAFGAGRRCLMSSVACLALCACMVGPDYHRPAAPLTPTFKELPGWKQASPQDATPKGAWWKAFGDPLLDRLEQQIDTGNQTLRAQVAAYDNAQALADEARASLFPTLSGNAAVTRSSGGAGSLTTAGGGTTGLGTGTTLGGGTTAPGTTTGTNGTTTTGTTTTGTTGGTTVASGTGAGGRSSTTRTQYTLEASADWNIDVWGKLRRQVESNVADAQASAALLANARLSAQASLATDYLDLRVSDALQRVLDETVRLDREALRIVQNQYNAGFIARVGRADGADAAGSRAIGRAERGRGACAI